MDIEKRAEKWVNEHIAKPETLTPIMRRQLILAYLAGAAQAQQDYMSYYAAQGAVRGLRHH